MANQTNALVPEQPGIFNQLYKTLVPVNARTLIDTIRGETAPITEKDFSAEELAVIRQMYEQKKLSNLKTKQQIANQLLISEKDYKKNPRVVYEYDETGLGTPRNLSYAEHIRKTKQALDTFENTKNKTSLSYYDYPTETPAPTRDEWLSSVWKSYNDPAYRMQTVLGSFNVMNTPEGQTAVDTYNFDKKQFYRSYYNIDPTTASVSDILKRSNGPVDFIDMMMIKKFPNRTRDVKINLGR